MKAGMQGTREALLSPMSHAYVSPGRLFKKSADLILNVKLTNFEAVVTPLTFF